ncbi:S41 family peptidase [Undibacterium sp. JH2W]|uniref:S41 family peptidase n=1 Tax=Undibacterium sp. JH2W TaxID=3413037 RepID=UPI003BF073A1
MSISVSPQGSWPKARHLFFSLAFICANFPAFSVAHAATSTLTTSPGAAPLAVAFDLKGWQADYVFLKQQLQKQYANLAWFATPQGKVNLPQLDLYTQKALALAGSDEQARAVLRNFIDAFHDGHLRLAARQDGTAKPGTDNEPATVAIDNMSMENACAAIGVGSTGRVQFSLPVESLPGFSLFSDGVAQAFRAGIMTTEKGGKLGILRIPRFREIENPGLCSYAWNTLVAAKQPVNVRKLKSAMADAWFDVLASHLARMKTAGVQALIVDVGGNGGGNDFGDWTARLLTAAPVRSAPLLMAAGPIAHAYLEEELRGMRKVHDDAAYAKTTQRAGMQAAMATFEKAQADMSTRSCDLSWVWQEQRPWQAEGCSNLGRVGFASGPYAYLPVTPETETDYVGHMYWPANVDKYRGSWTGLVYVLTDRGVGSAAEAFVAIMKDNGVAKTIGTITGGSGCGNMQAIRPITLPHSKLSFQAPDCVRLRKDGSDEVMANIPDIPLEPTPGESDRARAARLINSIEQDLASARPLP